MRVQKLQRVSAAQHTVFGWMVGDTAARIRELARNGVERYPHFEQDKDGVWGSPSGARVAWFRDPVGNLLSLPQGD